MKKFELGKELEKIFREDRKSKQREIHKQMKIKKLEKGLELKLKEAMNSNPQKIGCIINEIYDLQEEYQKLTGGIYKFKTEVPSSPQS